ncbi:MAG: hypothetical protein ACFFBJ_05530 [Promethearchaeota archaeon]
MNHRQRIIAVVVLTVVITLSVGFVTEYVREFMTFSWAIEENDEFLYDISVKGNTTTGSLTLPPQYSTMNNTRISVEVVSLPNVTIIFDGYDFVESIVEYLKTSTTFSNGSNIPAQYYSAINIHVSMALLPIGGWHHLDSLFPNDVRRPFTQHETYLSYETRDHFYFGYSMNDTDRYVEWHSYIDKLSGVPQIISFFNYFESPPWTYWYNVTLTIVT